jgi:hypothetical protein
VLELKRGAVDVTNGVGCVVGTDCDFSTSLVNF